MQVEFLSYTKPRYYYHTPPTHTHIYKRVNPPVLSLSVQSEKLESEERLKVWFSPFAVVYPEQAIMDLWHKHTATMIHFKECPKPTLPGAAEGSCCASPHALLGITSLQVSRLTDWLFTHRVMLEHKMNLCTCALELSLHMSARWPLH